MPSRDVTIRFLGNTSNLEHATERMHATIGNFGATLTSMLSPMAVVGTTVAAIGAGLGAFGLKAIQASADLEQSRIAFTTMLGSAREANAFLNQLKAFAVATPFEFGDLQEQSKRLLAMGFSAKQIIPTLTAAGDAAAALGQDKLPAITTALGQMQAKGKAQSDEMLQLTEAGVSAWDFLAKKLGTDVPTAMKRVEAGTVSSATAIAAITEGMESRFGGMMKAQSGTLTGMWSNVQDALSQSLATIGDLIVNTFDIKGKMAGLVAITGALGAFVTAVGAGTSPTAALATAMGQLGLSHQAIAQAQAILVPLLQQVSAGMQQLGAFIAQMTPVVVQLFSALWTQLQPSLVVIAQHSDELKFALGALLGAVAVGIIGIATMTVVIARLAAVMLQGADVAASWAGAVAGAIGRVTAAASGVGSLLYSSGQQLVQGFVRGIESMAGQVDAAVRRIVTGPIDAARAALGIHSPSAVFRDIGKNVVLGFAEGLNAPMPAAAGGSRTSNVTYNLNTAAPMFTNPADVGRMVVNAIQEYERRSGSGWRS